MMVVRQNAKSSTSYNIVRVLEKEFRTAPQMWNEGRSDIEFTKTLLGCPYVPACSSRSACCCSSKPF